jgi:hypothetical protein
VRIVKAKSFSLCPACDACPEVEVSEREVRIGEEGNLVRLKAEEWNTLVRLIRAGELDEL